jgi:MurNAc alpha-1-phosphate uridylyltransferase
MPHRAILFAAGRGDRLRPLTDTCPKPLLTAGGRALIEWQLERLVAGGFTEVVVNHSHLGEAIERALGDGRRFGARIRYSPESPALETAGGIARALPYLGPGPFLAVSSDLHTDFDYASLHGPMATIARDPASHAAHFVLVPNPAWHPEGDMGLAEGRVTRARPWYTYANISIFHAQLFAGVAPGMAMRLFPWAYDLVDAGRVSGEVYRGEWDNIGTAEQLAALDARLSSRRG